MPTASSASAFPSALIRFAPIALVVAAACGGETKAKTDTAAHDSTTAAATAATPAPASVVVTITSCGTDSIRTPESVKYDADQDAYFITNINGNPSKKDNNGFICRVPAERSGADSTGSVIARGGTNGVTLNAPKGTAIVADTLWVADIDAVRGFNRRTGALVASIDFSKMGAAFLNDIATGPDGALYITDTGIKFDDNGATSPAGKQRIFKLAGRSITVAAEGDSLQGPNGITWDGPNSRFLLAPFAGHDVQSWKPGDAAPAKVWTGPGQYDGIEVLADGRFLVSSWADSSVHQVKGTTSARIVAGADGPADIGVDTKRNRVLVPRFMANKVEAYGMP